MALPLADVAALEERLGVSLSGADVTRAAALLSDASALVRSEAGRTWLDADGALEDVPEVIAAVVLAAALRGWHNPAGVQSERVGDYGVVYGIGATISTLRLTSDERRLVRSFRVASGIASLRMGTDLAASQA